MSTVAGALARAESELAGAPAGLVERVRDQAPGAAAAVLARLWGAFARERLPLVASRGRAGGELVVRLSDGRTLRGPAAAAAPFAVAGQGLTVWLDGEVFADPAALLTEVCHGAGSVAAELAGSVANLALGRAGAAAAPTWAELAAMAPAEALVAAEQSVVDGHPLHPGCRFRGAMSAADVLAYGPEHRPMVALEVLEAPPGRWLSTGAGLPPRLLAHPWQVARVLDRYPGVRRVGRQVVGRPLMSLRTLSLGAGRGHVKTSVSAQMTSAVRIVSPAAVHNGPVVSALLARLAERTPGFAPMAESAAGAVLVDGAPCRELAMVLRDAPTLAPGEVAAPWAALTARRPAGAASLAGQLADVGYGGNVVALAADLATTMLRPVVALLHAGVALEAHGQNTLVVVRGGRPTRLLYRDTGGVRISARRLAAAGIAAPPLHGDLACEDPRELRTKVAAAVAVPLGEMVTVLAEHGQVAPERLWAAVSASARDAFGRVPGSRDRVLLDGPLPVKATTAMRLAEDPLADLWAWLPYGWDGTW
ncbi:IucA/IucC family protein [Pilimelia columellifera]|uniref:IucA/IucC family siderophore biosynthesis protein n=1 Tax=Pilimelia columellifera subsp. columellifera TaxID=706583 RepID=A0ABP6AZF1_9ACTN